MKEKELFGKRWGIGCQGFSLIELLVVMVILGVLAAAVLVTINTESSELKTFVFNNKAKFKMARFDAIKRGLDVYIDFNVADVVGAVDNGYTIWVDADSSGAPYVAWDSAVNDTNGNGECDAGDVGDCLIETVVFDNIISNPPKNGPEIYNPATASGGPAVNKGPGPSGSEKNIGVGVTAVNKRFLFSPNGDARAGELYLYYPEGPAGAKTVGSGPWALIVGSAGRVRVDRWNHMKTGDWDVDQ